MGTGQSRKASPLSCAISFVIYPLIPSQPCCQKLQNIRNLYRLQDEVTTDNDRRGLTTDQELWADICLKSINLSLITMFIFIYLIVNIQPVILSARRRRSHVEIICFILYNFEILAKIINSILYNVFSLDHRDVSLIKCTLFVL